MARLLDERELADLNEDECEAYMAGEFHDEQDLADRDADRYERNTIWRD